MKFETLIFDMDGVIIDSETLFGNADSAFFKRYGKTYDREKVAPLLTGMHLTEGTALIKEKYGFPRDIETLVTERQTLLENEYLTHLNYITGFEIFYERVISGGLKTCIATSSNDHLLQIAINKLKLDMKFGNNIFKASDVNNISKPNPAIYLYAAKNMNTKPTKCVVIEDSPKGIRAAKNAGMFCIGITTTFTKNNLRDADMIVNTYEEIAIENF